MRAHSLLGSFGKDARAVGVGVRPPMLRVRRDIHVRGVSMVPPTDGLRGGVEDSAREGALRGRRCTGTIEGIPVGFTRAGSDLP